MNNKSRKLVLVLFCFLISTPKNLIFGCQCGLYDSPKLKEHIKEVDLIAVGKVIKIQKVNFEKGKEVEYKEPVGDGLYHGHDFSKYKITVTISEKYKGKFRNDTILVFTGNGLGDCGYDFSIGSTYIIYGYKNSYISQSYHNNKIGIYSTSICTRTCFNNEKEVAELRKYLKLKKRKNR